MLDLGALYLTKVILNLFQDPWVRGYRIEFLGNISCLLKVLVSQHHWVLKQVQDDFGGNFAARGGSGKGGLLSPIFSFAFRNEGQHVGNID